MSSSTIIVVFWSTNCVSELSSPSDAKRKSLSSSDDVKFSESSEDEENSISSCVIIGTAAAANDAAILACEFLLNLFVKNSVDELASTLCSCSRSKNATLLSL